MPRKTLIRSNELPYHVTARCNNREAFPIDLREVWEIYCHYFYEVSSYLGVQVHAFVLMPNHIHLLLTTRVTGLDEVMRDIMRSVTKTINRKSGRSGRVFGSRYHWSLIHSPVYFAHALKYVYRNPVRARLCNDGVEGYPFSTLQGLVGMGRLPFAIYYPFNEKSFWIVPNEYEPFIAWLNQPFRKEHEEAIQKGLKRTSFSPPKQNWKRGLEELEAKLV